MGGRLVALAAAAACGACLASSASGWVALASGNRGRPRLDQPAASPHLVVRVRRGAVVALRDRPFGRVLERVGATTQFGSPQSFAVRAARNARWLAVGDARLGNGRIAWIDARAGGVTYRSTHLEIDVDLSAHTLTLRDGRRILRKALVGVGRRGSPTPAGRFAITDKLPGPAYSPYYGCCILALSATQPSLPHGWRGGDRVAIHGTPNTGDFGRDISAGCVHAPDALLQYLTRTAPLGTPVIIRR